MSANVLTRSAGRKLAIILAMQLVMVVIAVIYMLPVIHALLRSVGPPGGPSNYIVVINDPRLPRYYVNTIIVTAGTIVLTVTLASLAAFAFSKLHFPGKHVLFFTLLLTLLIPLTTLIVPLFVLVQQLGLYNTYLGLILPQVAFGVPFHTVLIKNYFDNLPNELLEAARIDGCSDFGIFWRIMLPLSLGVQVVVVTLTVLGSWNNYLLPLLLLKDEQMFTVSMAAVSWANQAGRQVQFGDLAYDTLFTALFVLAAPTVLLFLFLQRWFMAGVVQGAIKS
jgi:raffinose/stachyose/melibiose transport system permease protein